MTTGRPATRTRFDFDAVAVIAANQRRKERKKLRRLRKVRRALHFIGFLCYWAIALGITYTGMLIVAVVFIRLS